MNCPVDNTTLAMSERQGVEIDYCPQCRGVWLDRGELDKIIDRSGDFDDKDDRDERYERDERYDRDQRDDRRAPSGEDQRKKKKNFLSEIFEFGE